MMNRQRHECQLLDVSQGGTKIRANLDLELGDRIRLDIEGLGNLAGTVRWVRDSHAGIAFAVPVPYRELARWIASPAPVLVA